MRAWRKLQVVLAFAALGLLNGCPLQSDAPLGPGAQATLDPPVLGRWRCTGAVEDEPFELTVIAFDANQYYAEFAAPGEETLRVRAHATEIAGVSFLNVQELDATPQARRRYLFARYVVQPDDSLEVKLLRDESFGADGRDAATIAARLARDAADPALYEGLCRCTRITKTGAR